MKQTSVKKFEEWSGGSIFLGDEDALILDVCIDSRNVTEKSAFFAIKGENRDGHNFIFSAIEAGATAIVASDVDILESELKKYRKSHKSQADIVQNPFINVILVNDTVRALQDIASEYLKELDIKVVAVTGSVGKTSVKDMVAAVCACKYKTAKTQGNFNNELGLPLTIFQLDEQIQLAVLEMGMSRRWEIRRLVEIAKPKIGVITNIGVSHIENLGSREAICEEKMDIASFFDNESILVLNGDDDMLAKSSAEVAYKKVFVGTDEAFVAEPDVMISHIKTEGEIITFDLYEKAGQESVNVRLARAGRHNAVNAALALAVGKQLGICMADGASALQNAKYQARRLEFRQAACGFTVIDDTYNASPDSMRAALKVLQEIETEGNKIAVLADMLEMGKDSFEYHKKIGEYLAKLDVDVLFTYGEAASYIAKGTFEYNKNYRDFDKNGIKIYSFDDKDALVSKLKEIVKPRDVILVKGSNSMGMNEVANTLLKLID